MWSVHRHFLFIIALVGMISFACRDERNEEVEPDADLWERWINPTSMRLTTVDTVWKEDAVDCCMPFQIEHVEVKD
ncbi:MAG: hypothetical protein NZ521_10255, partial [Flammeovirgaceae bacterium]|nr:hypothetical protein [Flammeovirgaceae bacterium]MDW8288609.1 hypothetical protein [Flammeovirgaceae bacterium]